MDRNAQIPSDCSDRSVSCSWSKNAEWREESSSFFQILHRKFLHEIRRNTFYHPLSHDAVRWSLIFERKIRCVCFLLRLPMTMNPAVRRDQCASLHHRSVKLFDRNVLRSSWRSNGRCLWSDETIIKQNIVAGVEKPVFILSNLFLSKSRLERCLPLICWKTDRQDD